MPHAACGIRRGWPWASSAFSLATLQPAFGQAPATPAVATAAPAAQAPVPVQTGPVQAVAPTPATPTSPANGVPIPTFDSTAPTADSDATTGPRPYVPNSSALSSSDQQTLQQALTAAKRGSFGQADSLGQSLSSPIARKIVTWAILNNDGNIYSFAALDSARRDLWGWPRDTKRQVAAEKLIGLSGMGPQQIIDWFQGSPPQSVEGATALINAYQSLNRDADASTLAKTWWRTEIFDSIAQGNFYQAFSRYLTQDDHQARLYCLLLNGQGNTVQAARDLESYVDAHTRAVAVAALALRSGSASGDSLYTNALAGDEHNPVLAFARARYLANKDLEPLGFGVLADLPPASMSPDAATQIYSLRLDYLHAALKAHDYHAAYNAMNGGGFDAGESKAEAEFFAGWMALIKLNDPTSAIVHFQNLAEAGTSPITQGRANYWLGRAYEARNDATKGDAATAQTYYAKGGQYIYAFYGQMAAEKAGIKTITLGHDPVPTQADRDRFENRDLVKAARILGNMGESDLFHQIVLNLDTVLPNAEEEALLVDLTAQYDTQIMAMKVARMSMQRGFYLPERAYPLRDIPDVPGPEKAFVLAITRQESGFDPSVRSRANARGMMQLIPSTARAVSRRLGLPYTESKLFDPSYNMSLGTYHLGELVDHFSGSYILAAAGYNAGPSRMNLWIGNCGEPRGDRADALSFIECMPLRETRDYMMRVTENMRIYRARLNGGSAPLTAVADVTRGIPAPISNLPDIEDAGDGSTTVAPEGNGAITATLNGSGSPNGGPMSYGEYQKVQATQTKAEAQMAAAVAAAQAQAAAEAAEKHSKKHGAQKKGKAAHAKVTATASSRKKHKKR